MALDAANTLIPFITIQRDIYNLICWITTCTCSMLLLMIGIYHSIQTVRFSAPIAGDKNSRNKQNSVYLSFLLITVALIFEAISIHMTYTETYPLSLIHCELVKWLPTISYTLFKALVYEILVVRLWITFGQKTYSTKWLILWLFLMMIWTAFTNILNVLTTKVYINDNGTCSAEWSIWFVSSVAALDFSAAVLYSYLFMKPMLALHRTLNRLQELKSNQDLTLKRIAVKQCILALTATFATLICACFVVTFQMTQVFASIDTVISTLCIVLMFRWNDDLFRWIGCGKLVQCLIVKDRETVRSETKKDTVPSPRSPESQFAPNQGQQKRNVLTVSAALEMESRSMQTDSAYSVERDTCDHSAVSADIELKGADNTGHSDVGDPGIVIVFDDDAQK